MTRETLGNSPMEREQPCSGWVAAGRRVGSREATGKNRRQGVNGGELKLASADQPPTQPIAAPISHCAASLHQWPPHATGYPRMQPLAMHATTGSRMKALRRLIQPLGFLLQPLGLLLQALGPLLQPLKRPPRFVCHSTDELTRAVPSSQASRSAMRPKPGRNSNLSPGQVGRRGAAHHLHGAARRLKLRREASSWHSCRDRPPSRADAAGSCRNTP